MAMTLEQERKAFEDWLTDCDTNPQAPPRDSRGNYLESDVRDMWRVWQARANLTQPAQAVDVGAIREVIETVKRIDPHWSQLPKLTRALAGEKAEGWRDRKACAMALHAAVGAIYFADGSDYLSALWEVVRELGPDLVDELAVDPSAVWHRTMAETDRFTLPTPPTDGEE